MVDCPAEGCNYTSTEHGVKLHHKRSHGESLVKSDFVCDFCETEFKEYDCNREGHENIFCSPECRENFRREKSDVDWWHTCDFCDGEFRRHPHNIEKHNNNFCSEECFHEFIRENPDWFSWYDGGDSREYYGNSWEEQRQKAIERDNGVCQDCGLTRVKHRELFGYDKRQCGKQSRTGQEPWY